MKRKIPVDQLRIGMYVCGLDREWMDTPFATHRFAIREPAQLEQLRALCRHVVIDTVKGDDLGDPSRRPPPAPVERQRPQDPAGERRSREMEKAARLHEDATSVLDGILEDVRLGNSLDSNRAKSTVRELTAAIVSNPDALVYLAQIKEKDRYTSQHSVNVCILSLAFARHISLPRERMADLGLGALLHDVGKVRVPSAILKKPGPLTEEEFAEMRRHPLYSRQILAGAEGVSPLAQEVALVHHERPDGSGYPRGLRGHEIHLLGRIVAIADVYDALTSNRVYKEPSTPLEALRNLYLGRYQNFDGRLVEKFIQCLGIYPAGSLVQMSSGDIAVVVGVNPDYRTLPVVKLLWDKERRPYEPAPVVDLAAGPRRHEEAPLTVTKVVDPMSGEVPMDGLWRRLAAASGAIQPTASGAIQPAAAG